MEIDEEEGPVRASLTDLSIIRRRRGSLRKSSLALPASRASPGASSRSEEEAGTIPARCRACRRLAIREEKKKP